MKRHLTNFRFFPRFIIPNSILLYDFACLPSISAKLRREYETRTVVRRGTRMTASSLHPCHLLLPSILASSSCTPPFPSASPRRADLLVFFPFGPLSFGLLALYSVTATFVAPRVALPFSLAASSSSSFLLHSVLHFSLCPSGNAWFLFAPRFVSPFSLFSFLPALRFSLQAGPVASFVLVE